MRASYGGLRVREYMMGRILTTCVAVALGMVVMPQAAHASEMIELFGASPLSLMLSLAGLAVTMVLLVEVITLRKLALGGAIAERINYVVLAIVCLGASALAQWTRHFVEGVTLDQVQTAAEVLVTVAMALFGAYFWSVRKALEGYMSAMTGGQMLATEDDAGKDDGAEARRG
jgi:hypothetical protein